MTASSLLVFGTLLAMPLLAVPAIATGVAVDPRLARAAEAGAVIFVAMIALGVWCVVRDKPLEVIGKVAQATRNRLVRKREPITDLPEKLLRERDTVVRVLGDRWWEALLFASGRWVLDHLTLLAALYAVGAEPRRRSSCSPSLPPSCSERCRSRPAGSASSRRASPERSRSRASPRRRGRRHARLPARLVLATDPRGRGRGDHPQTQVRRCARGGARGGHRPEDLRARQMAAARERG